MHAKDWFAVVLAIIFPPLPVFMKRGFSADLLINVLLSVLGFIPGLLHAFYIISVYPFEEGNAYPIADRITYPGLQPPGYGSI